MVGQKILRTGVLDVKSPATSSLARGWRLPPWKTRRVDLVEGENGIMELNIYKENSQNLVDTYQLKNISDITMVTSKTHLHAFEIFSAGKSVLVMSGDTELESRDWIWTLRKIFWPDALEQIDSHDKISLKLISNGDTSRIHLVEGVYDIRVTTVAITISLLHKGDSRSTPVEPFGDKDPTKSVSLPFTTMARFRLEKENPQSRLLIETVPESKYGTSTFVFEESDEDGIQSVRDVMGIIKSTLFRATNSLHDCIASSQWTFDEET
ncbi:uncharacterized protein LOC123549221 [Mercenaria mercenaria]|uniref:uncharacterized protein LOC123549221 n=1 Tax=Mercenaria mercenaria TaxID=6596 RepID=UPI00234ECA6F|nr:uncharacterized protein LOC123549221 [Mercenaria mercenaria]